MKLLPRGKSTPAATLGAVLIALQIAVPDVGHASTVPKGSTLTGCVTRCVAAFFDLPGRDALPVERISQAPGHVATAHVRLEDGQFHVYGFVERSSLADPPPWAHLEVTLVDANGLVIKTVATNYVPATIPHRTRGEFPRSKYSVFIRADGPRTPALIRVTFRDDRPSSR